MKSLKTLLILLYCIIAIRSAGQGTSEICLTPNEYRFYAGAVIDRDVLVKDTARLDTIIRGLRFNIISLETSNDKCDQQKDKLYEERAIQDDNINKLQDKVDSTNVKVVRNRRIAIVVVVIAVVEA